MSSEPQDPDDRELEEFLAGRSPLSPAYREASRDTAPPQLDDAVLGLAREALKPPSRLPRRVRWIRPFAIAATLVVSFGVLLTVVRDPALRKQAVPGPETTAGVSAGAVRQDRQIVAPAETGSAALQVAPAEAGSPALQVAPAETGSPAVQKEDAPAREPEADLDTRGDVREESRDALEPSGGMARPVPPPGSAFVPEPPEAKGGPSQDQPRLRSAPKPVQPPSPPPPATPRREPPRSPAPADSTPAAAPVAASAAPAAAAASAPATRAPAAPAPPSPAPPSPAPMMAPAPDDSKDASAPSMMEQRAYSAPAAPAPPGAAQAPSKAKKEAGDQDREKSAGEMERTPGPDAWLAQIRALRDRGELDAARRELDQWRRSFPDRPVPEDLAVLVPAGDELR